MAVALAAVAWFLPAPARAEVNERTRLALEALSRLKGSDLESNPALKQAVLNVLDQVRGEPEWVEVVRDFRLPNQEAELVRIIGLHPQAPQSADAARLLLGSSNSLVLDQALKGEKARVMIVVLGNSRDSRATAWLQPFVTDAAVDLPLREAAVRALAQTAEGAGSLLSLAKEGKLPDEVRSAAGVELKGVPWPEVRAAAATIFPAASPTESQPWPPLEELLRQPGDPQRGAEILRRPEVACLTCHQIHAEGVDFGPGLSGIGTKLAKEALITSILEPSAGISFGYEAWRVELTNGDELFGILVSDAEEELAVKQQGGQVTRVKKTEVATREKQSLSLMPTDLHQSLSAQEFVDLIAYLVSLKTPGTGSP